ncbi:GGDEF domain-containing protein [Aquincola tertiaricarbonis]|uniref:GGDEF domain-containing protein n=1 Tax=Aquincola tertiaricarbonis TaxID=391953 RepID=UPI000614E25B|nr:GGDEF domain-containing protein [Aquincola tertiaricarbonis]
MTAALTPAQIAKGALRRLALTQQEPTPENYARAWAEELGQPAAALPERARPLLDKLAARASDDADNRTELVRSLMAGQWDDLARALDRSAALGGSSAQAWAGLIERIVRGLERSGRHWTAARKKDSLKRVLDGSRSDLPRLQQRLRQLVTGWDSDAPVEEVEGAATPEALAPDGTMPPAGAEGLPDGAVDAAAERSEPAEPAERADPSQPADAADPAAPAQAAEAPADLPQPATPATWPEITTCLQDTVVAALPTSTPSAAELAGELGRLADRIAAEGATPALAQSVHQVCDRARRLFAHRHYLLEQLGALCLELTAGLTELAEEGSWAQGQAEALRARLQADDAEAGGDHAAEGAAFSVRGVRAAGELLARTRQQQHALRSERDRARLALKSLIQSLLQQVGELGDETGRFSDNLGRYAESITEASSLDDLAGVVDAMVKESRAVQQRVGQAQRSLGEEHARASELESRVRDLEGELRRLSDEVATDALTQVANRRGLMQAFDSERARLERDGRPLAVGLIDIDNFKKLNDSLGHAAGDEALKSLARRVQEALRPVDHLARFGGEEFVVLLPDTPVAEAQQVLTRLQRQLTASLFMHDGQDVFVTFSAGVTGYRPGERLEAALERADEALYEAKHQGKNRTCIH